MFRNASVTLCNSSVMSCHASVMFHNSFITLHFVQLAHAVGECILKHEGSDTLFPNDFGEHLFYCGIVEKGRNSAGGTAVNGDMMNGDLVSGEITPSSDGDSVTLDASSDVGDAGRISRQDIITITGRRENCEAARDAMLVGSYQQQYIHCVPMKSGPLEHRQ